jgi:hypothetical protein
MKKFSLIAAAVLAMASSSAFALTASDGFDVTVNFTAACQVKTAAADMAFTYVAFGAAQSKTATTVFQCSRGLTPTFNFDTTGANQTGQAVPVAVGTAITGEGLISGVRYTLAGSSSKTQVGTAATAGTGGTGGTDGSGDEYTVGITAAIASQAGGTGTGGTHARTLIVTY